MCQGSRFRSPCQLFLWRDIEPDHHEPIIPAPAVFVHEAAVVVDGVVGSLIYPLGKLLHPPVRIISAQYVSANELSKTTINVRVDILEHPHLSETHTDRISERHLLDVGGP